MNENIQVYKYFIFFPGVGWFRRGVQELERNSHSLSGHSIHTCYDYNGYSLSHSRYASIKSLPLHNLLVSFSFYTIVKSIQLCFFRLQHLHNILFCSINSCNHCRYLQLLNLSYITYQLALLLFLQFSVGHSWNIIKGGFFLWNQ